MKRSYVHDDSLRKSALFGSGHETTDQPRNDGEVVPRDGATENEMTQYDQLIIELAV
jgi:hypothetical protein